MSGEEMERTIGLMIQHQAKFAEDTQRSIDFILQQQTRFAQDTHKSIELILKHQARLDDDMQKLKSYGFELAKAQIRTQNALADTAETHKQLAEEQKITEQRLNSLIATMERRFGGNGQGQK